MGLVLAGHGRSANDFEASREANCLPLRVWNAKRQLGRLFDDDLNFCHLHMYRQIVHASGGFHYGFAVCQYLPETSRRFLWPPTELAVRTRCGFFLLAFRRTIASADR